MQMTHTHTYLKIYTCCPRHKNGCTSTCRLCLVPLWVVRVHALDDDRSLLQGVPGVAGELGYGAHCVCAVTAREVAILDKWLVAVPRPKA